MRIAICPGSFDPVTKGHVDIIKRAAQLFDKVIVAVAINPKKRYTFTTDERVELVRMVTEDLENVEVQAMDGLIAQYCKDVGACAIVKGLRAVSDFENEFQMALANKQLNKDVETVFLTTSAEYMFLSSSVVKQIRMFGGDISAFIPDSILSIVSERLLMKDGDKQLL